MKCAVALCLVLAVTLGCHEPRSVTAPKAPGLKAAILDGAHNGGNPNFFFLPPLVERPTFSGVFNPNLGPVVEICTLTAAAACDPTIPLINPGAMQLHGQHYQVDWKTGASNLSTASTYRIQVFAANELLGFADVQPVNHGSGLRQLETGEVVGLVDGRTLPIKVRIENQALCLGQTDCVEQTVVPSTSEQDVVAPDKLAAVSFPAGYFSQTTTVVIDRVVEGCFTPSSPSLSLEALGCYNISTSPFAGDPLHCTAQAGDPPNTTDAATCARVEVCPLTPFVPGYPDYHDLRLLKSDPGVPATVLKEATATLITECPGVGGGLGLSRHRVVDLARARWQGVIRALGRLVMPTPAWGASEMTHLGVGGLSGGLSNIGWAPVALAPHVSFEGEPNLPIGGSVAVSDTVFNGSGAAVSGVSLQAFIVQGTTSQSAGTTDVFCSDFAGSLPPGLCASSNLSFTVPAGGTFTPGPATARFELRQGATLLDVFELPVTLVTLE